MVDRNDIILNDDFELEDTAADFEEGDSTEIDAMVICSLEKGELRYAPWLGYGIKQRLRGVANINRSVRELKVELESDGFTNPEVVVTNQDLSDLKIYV